MSENIRIQSEQAVINPQTLLTELPLSSSAAKTVSEARHTIRRIMRGTDSRLLIIVGPCSIHDTRAAYEYANLLNEVAVQLKDTLFIVMRTYFEKPRTTMGWKGLISDPFLDESFDTNAGLRMARKFLLEVNQLGLPTATEFLDTLIPPYLSDLISWCAIGARTSESQLHREMASGLSMPVGFKNTTDGNIQVAIDAVQVSANPHSFLSINQSGFPTGIRTIGNPFCHIVLRGSNTGTNYSREHVQNALATLSQFNLIPRLMIDCSHGNSLKNYSLQCNVIDSIMNQLCYEFHGILGLMLESNLVAGKQIFHSNQTMVYGQSITDGCIDWEETKMLLESLVSCAEQD